MQAEGPKKQCLDLNKAETRECEVFLIHTAWPFLSNPPNPSRGPPVLSRLESFRRRTLCGSSGSDQQSGRGTAPPSTAAHRPRRGTFYSPFSTTVPQNTHNSSGVPPHPCESLTHCQFGDGSCSKYVHPFYRSAIRGKRSFHQRKPVEPNMPMVRLLCLSQHGSAYRRISQNWQKWPGKNEIVVTISFSFPSQRLSTVAETGRMALFQFTIAVYYPLPSPGRLIGSTQMGIRE